MLPDIYLPFFLTHVGNLNTVKLNQRRFAPTSAHIAGIKCPHHWNTQSALFLFPSLFRSANRIFPASSSGSRLSNVCASGINTGSSYMMPPAYDHRLEPYSV